MIGEWFNYSHVSNLELKHPAILALMARTFDFQVEGSLDNLY